MRALALPLFLIAACHTKAPDPDRTTVPTSTPVASVSVSSAPAPVAPKACTSDLDCEVCGTKTGCGCSIAPDPACGPMEHPCFAPPCLNKSASCWAGKCVMRTGLAAPCAKDDECEVRADDCHCDLFAALKTSAPSKECAGRGCGGRPAPNQYRARCDATAKRCVLERAP